MIEFSYYINTYHGSAITEDKWNELALRAEERIKKYENLYTVTYFEEGNRDLAICAMAENINAYNEAKNGGAVSSVSVGSVSTTYASVDTSEATFKKGLLSTLRTYASIYRGA